MRFKPYSIFSGKVGEVEGQVMDSLGNVAYNLKGNWTDHMTLQDASTMDEPEVLFFIFLHFSSFFFFLSFNTNLFLKKKKKKRSFGKKQRFHPILVPNMSLLYML